MGYIRLHHLNDGILFFAGEFQQALNYWNDAVQGNPNVRTLFFDTSFGIKRHCGVSYHYSAGSTLPGLDIFTNLISIDGKGGTLGQAWVCYEVNNYPRISLNEYELVDLMNEYNKGNLVDLIRHEIGHALGLGSSWPNFNLVSDLDTNKPKYIGYHARTGYMQIGGGSSTSVPLENTGGSGTRNKHWKEKKFGKELMTGYLDDGKTPISMVSLMSLMDMGYIVDLSKAESFTVLKETEENEHKGTRVGNDVKEFEPFDLEVAIAENEANVRFQQELIAVAIVVGALAALIALLAFRKKNRATKSQVVDESKV
eukprot:augustus_masked-scaffold_51-processed-gene-1.91-mRNA-1 protein AED:1.00 eAED:1.00 QI:0/-1/0/0/-1/1/1/0/311